MNLEHNYWYFESALTPRFCDDVIAHALNKKEKVARAGDFDSKSFSDEDVKKLQTKRQSDVVWLEDQWIYKEIQPYLNKANKNAGWNFQFDWSQPCQFTKYKLGQFYNWHCDSFCSPYKRKGPDNGKIRKLSMTCQLTDGSEYKGGELEFDLRNYDPPMRDESKHLIQCKQILPKGSIIVFPSFMWHRVKPVTKGTRYSLVMWTLGYPFK
tara:strand:- start:116 stop:745 length:630 start_codon:yes stop_codon:yes gene_type:complete